ncbi:hypothetical protein COX00_00875 [Candidatus Uhrbacteria bacterium CG22_combo_CG10-13_8_21_14_all_47_17]|uniref:DUF2304 domain-containing protein n=1 Tax=Candidatus Uhrbacteria bacterium CG22_combo_CG10-13_8_21_14_all_47_17 TaxID=1975041 RepID=A0A2H0BTM1_9BACT|nr:MAG: hypothetical protein COX00_00875 [Candidatus Uhrbacteria bacterium CG22_combo_CG10-13_8_21_14_all_47_17]
MLVIQLVLLAALFAAFLLTWKRAQERVIRRREALIWSALWMAAALLIFWPELASHVASFVGVGRGADLVVYAAVIVLFVLIFNIHVALDRLDRKLTQLVRQEALKEIGDASLKPEDTRV